jgi:hypothetical protein
MPLVSFRRAYRTLTRHPESSSMCFAGIAGVDVPLRCVYSMQAHWDQKQQIKIHQWTVLARRHVEKVVDPVQSRAARNIFAADYTAEPLCSDELFPVLAIISPWDAQSYADLPVNGLIGDAFFADVASYGIRSECFMFAYWRGCTNIDHPLYFLDDEAGGQGAAKGFSCGSFDDMDEPAKDALADYLPTSGMLFARKVPGIASRMRRKLRDMMRCEGGDRVADLNCSALTQERDPPTRLFAERINEFVRQWRISCLRVVNIPLGIRTALCFAQFALAFMFLRRSLLRIVRHRKRE